MISVDRGLTPPFFSSASHNRLKAEAAVYFTHYNSEKRRTRYNFKSTILQAQVKPVLLERFAGKCAYCESPLSSQQANIDYFRPRMGARGYKDQAQSGRQGFYENHYWWLAWEWHNMLLACAECDRRKSSWFPLVEESARADGPTADLTQEQPLLLNPCDDNPDEHLRFTPDGHVRALTARGTASIEILSLNRSVLVEQRRYHIMEISKKLEIVKTLRQEVAGTYSRITSTTLADLRAVCQRQQHIHYLAAQRHSLLEWIADDFDLLQLLDVEPSILESSLYDSIQTVGQTTASNLARANSKSSLGRLAIERIELRNFKNIAHLTLQMPEASEGGHAPWLLFIGENAVGKSSVMQAIVLTLMGDDARERISGISPADVLRYRQLRGQLQAVEQGWVKIWVSGETQPLQLSFRKGSNRFESNVPTSRGYLIAYGSTRLLPDSDSIAYEKIGAERVRVRHLFKASTPLIAAEEWLYSLYEKDPVGFDLLVRGLRDMLLMQDGDRIMPDNTHPDRRRILVDFKSRGEISTISHLSDGYRTVLALACDMMSMLADDGTSMEAAEGIVIIDELESNLHPSWKKRIVGCFRKVFPQVQFIVSTHDPLCLRGIFEHETVLLRRDSRHQVVAINNLPNPNDLRVDELLSSEFFGLNTTLDTDLEDIYNEYYSLLIKQHPTLVDETRVSELKKQLQQREHLGHSLREELMYEVIDKLIARERVRAKPKNRVELKKETLNKVLKAWEDSGSLDNYASPA